MRTPLKTGKAAGFLLRRYGSDSAAVASRRANLSAGRNDAVAASEWRLVLAAIDAFYTAEPDGAPH